MLEFLKALHPYTYPAVLLAMLLLGNRHLMRYQEERARRSDPTPADDRLARLEAQIKRLQGQVNSVSLEIGMKASND